MIHDFSETKERNERLEKELRALKKDYNKPQMTQMQLNELRQKMEEANMKNKEERNISRFKKISAIAAVFVGAFILLPNTSSSIAYAMEQIPVLGKLVEVVTFRDYEYNSDRNNASIKVPEIQPETNGSDDAAKENLSKTTDEINAEIQAIADRVIEEFESELSNEDGYQSISVTSEILCTTPEYFTLKLICFQSAGSGYEWDYYYTIDLTTGDRLKLKDLFKENSDYITPISENIKVQMQEQMDADENVRYWLNDEVDEWNFKSITDETSFYVNENNNVVIAFNEGDVAPMYMGTVEFEIPAEILSDIRK